MSLSHHNFYHPFNDSYLGMFLEDPSCTKNERGFVMDNINLYHQPLPEPLHAIAFCFVRTLLVIFAEFVQVKVLRSIKKENGIINKVATLYILTLMVAGPYFLIMSTLIDLIHPVHKILGKWFCYVNEFVGFLLFNITAFHSFAVALMRYVFIVHRQTTIKYGKEKCKTMFFFLSFFIPVAIDIFGIINNQELDPIAGLRRCKGVDHKMFLVKSSTLDAPKLPFCEYKLLPEDGQFGEVFAVLRYIHCIVTICIYLIMGFNFMEGFIYYKTFSHIMRY